jgi:hypothetical protein
MTTSKKKRKCLLRWARKGLSLSAVNRRLKEEGFEEMSNDQWVLWGTYYVEFVKDDPYFEHELINNNRSLSWFASEANRRKTKTMLS